MNQKLITGLVGIVVLAIGAALLVGYEDFAARHRGSVQFVQVANQLASAFHTFTNGVDAARAAAQARPEGFQDSSPQMVVVAQPLEQTLIEVKNALLVDNWGKYQTAAGNFAKALGVVELDLSNIDDSIGWSENYVKDVEALQIPEGELAHDISAQPISN